MLHFVIAMVFLDLGVHPVCSQPHTSTHWVVTENGLIRPRENSPYNLARPYDLIGLLSQENIYSDIINSYQDLFSRQDTVNLQWISLQQLSNFKPILNSDDDCIKGGPMNQVDLFSRILDTIRTEVNVNEYFFDHSDSISETEPPNCEKFSNLPFSMFTFDHLEAMSNRSSLSMDPDLKLKSAMFKHFSVEEFGNKVTDYLKKNQSSWLHYNFGSIYWKIVGNVEKALECSRRAVYFAPRIYKDIALLNLGSIFMRCRKTHECHVILSSALDHAPQYAKNHFAMGNAYALLGELNSSIACYDKSIQLDPTLEAAVVVRHSILCQYKLVKQLEQMQQILRMLRANLTEYNSLEFNWWKQQALFLNSMDAHSQRFQDLSRTSMNTLCEAMGHITKLDFCSLKRKGDISSLVGVLLENSELPKHLYSPMPIFPANTEMSLEKFLDNIETQISKIISLITKSKHLRAKDGRIQSEYTLREFEDVSTVETYSDSVKDDEGPIELDSHEDIPAHDNEVGDNSVKFAGLEEGTMLYPPTYKVNRNREDFDTKDDWPPTQLCEEWASKFPANLDTIYPVFLPFENKGLRIQGLLSDKIELTLEEEHPLPWHPPICHEVKGSTSSMLPKLPKGQQNADRTPTDYLRSVLLNYVSNGNVELVLHMHEAEIGQRILTAYKKKVAPAWIVHTLSSLYWRVRRNYANALTCLASAIKLAPPQYRDIAQVSLASVLLQVGYVDEALAYASQAFRISSHEPATNFLLSLIHMSAKNRMAHIYHMRQVVRVEPVYMDGLARKLLYAWSCKYSSSSADTETSPANGIEEVCHSGEQNGQKLTCTPADGDSCLLSSVHSLKHNVYKLQDEISTIMRLLDLKSSPRGSADAGDGGGRLKIELGEVSEKKEYSRKLQYIILNQMLKNCGDEDCSKLYPVRASAVQTQPCFFQHLRFWYWFPYIHLETLIKDRGIRIPKLSSEKTSSYTFPECKLPKSNGDPMLEWLSKLDTNGWSSFTALITEVTVLLGKKFRVDDISAILASEVHRSGSWLTLVLAGLWCGGFARGGCCVRCMAAALHAAPLAHKDIPLLSLVGVLHLQERPKDAKQAAYFALLLAPKNKLHLFVAGITNTYVGDYESAIRMFRTSLSQQTDYEVARLCLHATMCLVYYADDITETKGLFFN